jgi:hypothetical protein
MTNHEPTSPNAGERDISELSRAILDGDRAQLAERPPPPPRRIVPSAVASLRVPAMVAQVTLAAWVPLAGLAVVFSLMQRSLAQRVIDDPTQVRYSEVVADKDRVDTVNGLFIALIIITGVAFIVWFRRAYRNLDALDAPRRYGIGWAIGSWLVPIVSLFMPKRIADDIWAATDVATPGTAASGLPRPKSGLISLWWGTWLVSTGLGVAAGSSDDPKTLQEVLSRNGIYLARDVALIVAAVLAVLVVRRITKGQEDVVEAARAR